MTKSTLIEATIYLIGTGEVAKAALYKLVKLYPEQAITVVASNRSGGLDLLNKNVNDDLGASHVGFKQVDIYNDKAGLAELINSTAGNSPQLIFNLGSPYLDMVLMELALETNCHYVDTACYEELDTKGFSYKQQLTLAPEFEKRGLKALLGGGGSPGITNAITRFHDAYRTCESVKIFDYNGGSQNKYPWATNFAAEDNLKELDNPAKFLRDGEWVEVPAFSERFHIKDPLNINDDVEVGFNTIYHEEQETINMVFPHIKNIYNYMSFGEDYIKFFKLFRDLGLMGVEPVDNGQGGKIIPIRFLASLMPHPRDVAPLVTGPAGMRIESAGVGAEENDLVTVWRMKHEDCFADTKTGAVAWSTGVPACLFMDAMLQFDGTGVFVPENLPNLSVSLFDDLSAKYGLEVDSYNAQGEKVSL
ncbi:MAG: saccharopine dehydrogenase NADP-binding domain-containing protein [Alphaproteobacteria bacterium]|nr:saccharopine dehydrogenase NADP-binding domain-containing protein [Alphaproteobacteria bacterium]